MNLSTVLWLHDRVGNAAPLFMALVGLFSLVNFFRGLGLNGSVIGAIIIGEVLMLVQVVLGLMLLLGGGLYPDRGVHFLYGSLTVLFFPGLWVYTRGQTDRRASLIWGIGGLFMMGLALRAIGTAA